MISIVTPTFNEEQNIKKLYLEIKEIFTRINLEYEQIIIDNNSTGNRNNYSSNNDNLYTGVPDPYGTGKVDKETYESTGIGEKYCQ